MQPYPEHEQDDPHLGELLCQMPVGDEARSVRSHGNAGQEVADDGRKSQSVRHVAQDQRGRQTASQGQDQVEAPVHSAS
jgi:hypothetical protein